MRLINEYVNLLINPIKILLQPSNEENKEYSNYNIFLDFMIPSFFSK